MSLNENTTITFETSQAENEKTPTLPTLLVSKIEKETLEKAWLIKPLWTNMAVGIIGGAPKCCKSWLGLDMAVSIASGTPCLNFFPVEQKGPVLIYLAEDALSMVRSRIENICTYRKIAIDALPLHVITAPTLRLDRKDHQRHLQNTLALIRPKMLLLDPLVRLHRLDENSAQDISGILGYLRELQRTYQMAVMIVHHASKKHYTHPGQALRGSSDLHAFGDSNAYLKRKNDQLLLTIEHRSAPSPEPVTLQLSSKPDQNHTCLTVVHSGAPPEKADDLSEAVLELLTLASTPLLRTEIRRQLKVNNQRLGDTLTALKEKELIEKTKTGWILKSSSPRPQAPTTGPSQIQLPLPYCL